MAKLKINGATVNIKVEGDTPLLWVLREQLGLTGSKYGCGHAVNPQQIEAQVKGSFVCGLSALLYGEITVNNGRIEQGNFGT